MAVIKSTDIFDYSIFEQWGIEWEPPYKRFEDVVEFGDYYYGVIDKPIPHSNDKFIEVKDEHQKIFEEWARLQNIDLKTLQVMS